MTNNDSERREIQGHARLLETIAWGLLLLCAIDYVFDLPLLGAELRVFFSALAATLLIIGIIVRKKARPNSD